MMRPAEASRAQSERRRHASVAGSTQLVHPGTCRRVSACFVERTAAVCAAHEASGRRGRGRAQEGAATVALGGAARAVGQSRCSRFASGWWANPAARPSSRAGPTPSRRRATNTAQNRPSSASSGYRRPRADPLGAPTRMGKHSSALQQQAQSTTQSSARSVASRVGNRAPLSN